MQRRRAPPALVLEYRAAGKLFHHAMPVDTALSPAECEERLRADHRRHLQPVGRAQVVDLLAQLCDGSSRVTMAAELAVGDKVEARYQASRRFYPGAIQSINRGDGTCNVLFDDGDEDGAVPAAAASIRRRGARCFFDVAIGGRAAGRLVLQLFDHEVTGVAHCTVEPVRGYWRCAHYTRIAAAAARRART